MNEEERALIELWARGLSAARIDEMLTRSGGAVQALRALDASSARMREGGSQADAILERASSLGARIVTRASRDYPAPLKNIPDPPAVLYVKGRGSVSLKRAAAIAGTRSVSSYGREVARMLGAELGRHGVTVVTGLSDGVDAIAAEACVEAGGTAVGVLVTGIGEVYPRAVSHVFERVMERGVLVSEFAPQTRPNTPGFHARNRVISGLASVVILVEGSMQSGSVITVGHAADYGKEVMAVPGNITSPGSALPNDLIRSGAPVVLDVYSVLEHMGWGERPAEKREETPVSGLSPHETQVLDALHIEPLAFDALCEKTNLDANVLNSLLTRLELRGIIRQSAGRVFERVIRYG